MLVWAFGDKSFLPILSSSGLQRPDEQVLLPRSILPLQGRMAVASLKSPTAQNPFFALVVIQIFIKKQFVL